jgi:hypothetical protein
VDDGLLDGRGETLREAVRSDSRYSAFAQKLRPDRRAASQLAAYFGTSLPGAARSQSRALPRLQIFHPSGAWECAETELVADSGYQIDPVENGGRCRIRTCDLLGVNETR